MSTPGGSQRGSMTDLSGANFSVKNVREAVEGSVQNLMEGAKDREGMGIKNKSSWRKASKAQLGRRMSQLHLGEIEDAKKRQQNIAAMKHKLKATLDDRHKNIIAWVSRAVSTDASVTENAILEEEQMQIFNDFLKADGRRVLMFFFLDPNSEESKNGIKPGIKENICISDGSDVQLTGGCAYFIKTTPKQIATSNMYQELNFGIIDTSKGSILQNLEDIMQGVLIPSLKAQGSWGELKTDSSDTIQNFLETLDRFSGILNEANACLEDQVDLLEPEINVEEYTKAADYVAASNNPEVVDAVEDLVTIWSKQIDQVLAESEQMRKEADDIGPKAELEHWKHRMSKFNSLLDQIKSKKCKVVIGIMNAAKSRSLKSWKELDNRITDAANEAKDNVKYLYTLETFSEPLYKRNPVEMIDHIPGLINAIRMIHSISRYYNTSERMTSLFVKITNQMISACKHYVYADGSKIWEQDSDQLIDKLNNCIALNDEYQKSFQKVKQKLQESPNEKPFDFSEMYIFGKFDTFCKRLSKVIEMLTTISSFNCLKEVKIEGLEQIYSRFNQSVSMMKKKPYDILDHRKMEFDSDYKDFLKNVQDMDVLLQSFLDKCFEKLPSTSRALDLLVKFEKLDKLNLDLNEKYAKTFSHYGKDIEFCRRLYQKLKDDPPIPRDSPPIAGRIIWARQLFRKIEEPMLVFQKKPSIVRSSEGVKIIRNYNNVASVLMEFEMLYHKAWFKVADSARSGLQASLLVRHPQTGELFVNFDPEIPKLLREAKLIKRLNLEIPEGVHTLCCRASKIKENNDLLNYMLEDYNNVIQHVPAILKPLIQYYINRVENALDSGVSMLSWTSLNLDQYLSHIYTELSVLKDIISKSTDILDCRIQSVLESISKAFLGAAPEDCTWSTEQYLQETEARSESQTLNIEVQSQMIERAVLDLILILTKAIPEESLTEEINNECKDLQAHFNQKLLDGLIRCTRGSLDMIKKKLTPVVADRYGMKKNIPVQAEVPFFETNISLVIPNIVVSPTLDDIQQALNKSAVSILNVSKGIYQWSQDRNVEDKTLLKSYFNDVSNNKDIVKLVMMLTSAVNSAKKDISTLLEDLSKYNTVWQDDKDQAIDEFMAGDPILSDFETMLQKYDSLEEEILQIPDTYIINCIEPNTKALKAALITETRAWKQKYGSTLNNKSKSDLEKLSSFINEISKRLSRSIQDLDDVRQVMKALTDLRENEVRVEMDISPLEESYAMLTRYELLGVTKEESERVDGLRYAWQKLKVQSSEVQDNLIKLQSGFKEKLLTSVEVFSQDQQTFLNDYSDKGPMVPGIKPREASDRLTLFQRRFDDIWNKYEIYSGGEELFGLTQTEYPELVTTKKELKLLNNLYGLYNSVLDSVNGYYDILWQEVDMEAINIELQEFQTKCRKLPKALKEWDAYIELSKTISDFCETLPLIEMMANKAMQPRHWEAIANLTDHVFPIESDTFLLRNVMEAPLLKYKEDVEEICIAAVKEKEIEAKLKVVMSDWSANELQFANFKTRGPLLLKGNETAELLTLMEDSLMVLGSLMSNRYNAHFKPQIQKWVQQLSTSTELIEQWLMVQNLWVYLEAVFVGGDIAKQLPKEAKRFQNIDKSYVKIMQKANETPNVIQCCVGDETLQNLLPHLAEQLEVCQKSLSGYLESKRAVFPRFYFVSDPALLEILGQASDSHTIQAHLVSCFDNVKTATFHEKEYDKILAIASRESESYDLTTPVLAQGNVEVWLGALLVAMQKSLNDIIRFANAEINKSPFNYEEFFGRFPSQVGLLGLQMIWTRDSEEALQCARSDKKIMPATNQKFLDVLNMLIAVTTRDLTKMERVKYETLITIHVHQRDVFDNMVKIHIKAVNDFEWLKQARFYWKEDLDTTLVQITDVNFLYQNEFLGCTDRLVITPLTDRCYITLAQALGMCMGGAPAGPAGTGKTETVKDMGRALAKYVVVFNCSDQMDYRGLGRIYKGLAQSGSWGCFDEFNRIDLPVLSVAAQQITSCLVAKKERKKEFVFTDGETVELNPEFGFFITMNPGYAGRQELPENLKVQFRSVAMMVPDRQIIKRVKLASAGFINNQVLARKFFVLYKLCEQQLSKQIHYDFGLRNILSVLRTLGAVKRASAGESENLIVMRVLRDMNLSKLIDEDEPLFLSLINDLFPGLTTGIANYPELENALQNQVKDMGLIYHSPWVQKIIQLYETNRVRHGIMVLGPTGAGKTKCINALMRAMTECGDSHKEFRMNPKAITASQMFGRLDVATNDWTDGIFSALWRKTLKAKKTEFIWIVMDGPVDAIWIENLNSVLDDSKILTLANGDRISMSPTCKLVFEVDSLANASPATVSRNGMIFMSSSVLDWKPILQGWLLKRSDTEKSVLQPLFESSFENALVFIENNLNPKMHILQANIIKQAMTLLAGLLPEGGNAEKSVYEKIYAFTIMWSVGALLELSDRALLQEHLLKATQLPWPKLEEEEDIYDFMVSPEGEWTHWKNHVPEYKYPESGHVDYLSIIVPTVDNVRTEFLIQTIAKQEECVLLIGEQGTAKTVMVKSSLSKHDPDVHVSKSMNFSSATTPLIFQRTIESYVDKRMGTTFGPPAGKKMTVFVDDINMPEINEWGDQITNEIVRQIIEQKGLYNLEKPGDFVNIVDLQFIGAMIHPGGGRNDIPYRLKRKFNIFNCTLPSNISVDVIFGTIGKGHFGAGRDFPESVIEAVPKLVTLTRVVWQQTKVKMLPTPDKFHYVFNLRDLSKIWQGMLKGEAEVIGSDAKLLALWKHELTRVIADRFTNAKDKEWFEKNMAKVVQENLENEQMDQVMKSDKYFVDFLRDAPEVTGEEEGDVEPEVPKVYEPIESFESLKERLEFFMGQYNENVKGGKLELVFFEEAMIHLVKLSRVIRTPRGHCLLVGVGGSGKQSLTRLASYIADCDTFQITLTKSYNLGNLFEDLKFLYKKAGLNGKGMVFLFTDNEIKDEMFLECLNNVLTSGEVSNLFARDEIDEIVGDLRPIMKKVAPGIVDTNENLYDFFISRVKQNLHVVLCFSPVGEKFRNRAMKFPGLISGCTMDWFGQWPKEALVVVADSFLSKFDIVCTPEIKQEVVKFMGFAHDAVSKICQEYFARFRRQCHVTPKSFLSFISSYMNVYALKKEEIGNLAERMNMGLSKLIEASESVAQLQIELVEKEKELAVAVKKTDAVLVEVTASTQAAEKVKAAVQAKKDAAQVIVDSINADKAIAEEKLRDAQPALEAAKSALDTIQPSHISTVRKLAKPPHLIMRIMDCVLLLRTSKIDAIVQDPDRPCCKPSWAESLKLMSQSNFLSGLQNFPLDTINEEMVEFVEPYKDMEDFNLENAKRVCGDVAGLCSWVLAMIDFYWINKMVLPLKANLIVQEHKLNAAMADLATAQALLDEKQAELDVVQAQFDAAMSEKQALQDDADSCRRKMSAATALIGGLGGEKVRWTEQSKEFEAQISRLVGDVLIGTSFLSYSGPFNQEFRNGLRTKMEKELTVKGVPFTKDLDVTALLVDATTVGSWQLEALPTDELSIQNGIIVTQSTRYPLLIDPQGQGKTWIINRETPNNLQITTLSHKYFRNHLEDCLSLGSPLLLEDVGEELDPALDNILEKNFIKSGKSLKVKLGDKEVDVMDGFVLYITTKLANPRYTPETSAKTAIIDFTVTINGLEDQLLGRVIQTEKQELEQERQQLIEDVTGNKKKMKELEDNLLFRLTSTQGSLVDDESLIDVLAVTKRTSEEVKEKLIVAAETEIKINAAREEFRTVATRGSILYFLIVEMSLVNVMYQTSLPQFLQLFDKSMADSDASPIPAKRITNITEFLTYSVFKYISRSLYEEHKFLFTLLLTLKIEIKSGSLSNESFQTFVKGGAALNLNASPAKPANWIPDMSWLNLVAISQLHAFADILNQVSRNDKPWKSWYEKEAPEQNPFPDGYENMLDPFHRLLLVRSWCQDRTIFQARQYISSTLGQKYAEAVILDLEETWKESSNRIPLICLLSMGGDPTASIESLAKKHKFETRAISMGQGQEVHARRLLQSFTQSGGWVLLQNCHLGLSFMDELLEFVLELQNPHEDFRLWITTEVHPVFPIGLLQIGIKFTNEPPQGVKAGMKRTYNWITQDMLDVTNLHQWQPMLYAMSFTHTTVQERRKFGPLGWNIPYEFNHADLASSIQFIQNHLDEIDAKKGVSWSTVRYMISAVHYGGRITDDFDQRLMNTYCKVWFGEHIFGEKFCFFKGYNIPVCKSIDEYRAYIETLPLVDTPEVFGLHSNADITYQSNLARNCLDTILNIQPKDSGGGGGETRESIVQGIASDMLSKLPPDYVKNEVKTCLTKLGGQTPSNIFLGQELDRMQKILSRVRSTLQDLQLAIDGTIIMSESLESALESMFNARVPPLWSNISWPSSTLGFWFSEVLDRVQQFTTWLTGGRPASFWMTGFFNPIGFLTAMKQEVARAHKGWALDMVTISTEVLKSMREDIDKGPSEGVYVHGLFLEGANWDRRNIKLIEPTPKILYTPMSVVWVNAVNSGAQKDQRYYSCPVYKKPRRTDPNYIFDVDLKVGSQTPEHWTVRGVALLCDIK
eukprot:Nk52_evm5s1178 gene=Nk52_evmTU5s1178